MWGFVGLIQLINNMLIPQDGRTIHCSLEVNESTRRADDRSNEAFIGSASHPRLFRRGGKCAKLIFLALISLSLAIKIPDAITHAK
jgi:hypothetical protein